MSAGTRRDAARLLPRRTIRLRLTLFSGALFLASGAVLLTVTYLLVRFGFPADAVHTYSDTKPPGGSGAGSGARLASLPSPSALGAEDSRQHGADLEHLLIVSGLVLVALAFASILLGYLVAGRLLRPLRTITAAARATSSAGLHRRLALTGPDDEIKELADTFDALLARLERSFAAQRQFVANASHELRTPLTLERALLDAALGDPGATRESLAATCERLLVANGRQERMIEALLTLATSERGIERRDPIDLAELAEQAVAQRVAQASRAGLRFENSLAAAPASGDSELSERLIGNLVENAVRYNVPGGRVEVTTGLDAEDGKAAFVRVANTGPLVAETEVGALFQPFRRAGGGRSRRGSGSAGADGGAGLGLSIVEAVAQAHGARVEARARGGGGLEVEVRYPAAET